MRFALHRVWVLLLGTGGLLALLLMTSTVGALAASALPLDAEPHVRPRLHPVRLPSVGEDPMCIRSEPFAPREGIVAGRDLRPGDPPQGIVTTRTDARTVLRFPAPPDSSLAPPEEPMGGEPSLELARARFLEHLRRAPGMRPPPPQAPPLGPGIRELDDEHFEVPLTDLDDAMARVRDVAREARLVPAFQSGHPVGIKLWGVLPGSLYARLGLQSGDVLSRLNGTALIHPDAVKQACSRLRDAQTIELELLRRGVRRTHLYRVR
ncbi:hypothetical protein DRW03_29620 [Corallococcus sp. H22C18031201]|nr:hypothetical protein DRW03_29620 [Corallococcus sp. H22C18031201]